MTKTKTMTTYQRLMMEAKAEFEQMMRDKKASKLKVQQVLDNMGLKDKA